MFLTPKCVAGAPVGTIVAYWELPGVSEPHDMALVASPVRLAGAERPIAILVGETRPQGSRLHKFILLPEGARTCWSAAGMRCAPLCLDSGGHVLLTMLPGLW